MVAVEADGELEIVEVVTGLDLGEQRGLDLQILRRAIELLRDNPIEIKIFHRYFLMRAP
jgi:hypothetical protein